MSSFGRRWYPRGNGRGNDIQNRILDVDSTDVGGVLQRASKNVGIIINRSSLDSHGQDTPDTRQNICLSVRQNMAG